MEKDGLIKKEKKYIARAKNSANNLNFMRT